MSTLPKPLAIPAAQMEYAQQKLRHPGQIEAYYLPRVSGPEIKEARITYRYSAFHKGIGKDIEVTGGFPFPSAMVYLNLMMLLNIIIEEANHVTSSLDKQQEKNHEANRPDNALTGGDHHDGVQAPGDEDQTPRGENTSH